MSHLAMHAGKEMATERAFESLACLLKSGNPTAQQHAATALCDYLAHKDAADSAAVVAAGAIQPLVRLLASDDNAELQYTAFFTLLYIAESDAAAAAEIAADATFFPNLRAILRAPDNPNTVWAAGNDACVHFCSYRFARFFHLPLP